MLKPSGANVSVFVLNKRRIVQILIGLKPILWKLICLATTLERKEQRAF